MNRNMRNAADNFRAKLKYAEENEQSTVSLPLELARQIDIIISSAEAETTMILDEMKANPPQFEMLPADTDVDVLAEKLLIAWMQSPSDFPTSRRNEVAPLMYTFAENLLAEKEKRRLESHLRSQAIMNEIARPGYGPASASFSSEAVGPIAPPVSADHHRPECQCPTCQHYRRE
jgi:hypothetical protein